MKKDKRNTLMCTSCGSTNYKFDGVISLCVECKDKNEIL